MFFADRCVSVFIVQLLCVATILSKQFGCHAKRKVRWIHERPGEDLVVVGMCMKPSVFGRHGEL